MVARLGPTKQVCSNKYEGKTQKYQVDNFLSHFENTLEFFAVYTTDYPNVYVRTLGANRKRIPLKNLDPLNSASGTSMGMLANYGAYDTKRGLTGIVRHLTKEDCEGHRYHLHLAAFICTTNPDCGSLLDMGMGKMFGRRGAVLGKPRV